MNITFKGRTYRLIPFVITQLILLFCLLLIVNACYKYHLETEERRLLLNTIKCDKCRLLVDKKTVEEVKTVEEIKPVEEVKSVEKEKNFYESCLKLKDVGSSKMEVMPKEFETALIKFIKKEKIKLKYNEEYKIINNETDDLLLKIHLRDKKDINWINIYDPDDKFIDWINVYDGKVNNSKVIKFIVFTDDKKYYTIKD